MSVYKPKNSKIYLYDFQRNGDRFHGSTGCTTKRDAEKVEALRRAEVALDVGRRKRPTITLDDAFGLYETRLRATGKWSATCEYVLADVIEAIGGSRYLSDIAQGDLGDYAARRAGKVSAASVNREMEIVRAAWRWADRSRYDVGEMPDWGALTYAVAERDPRELKADEETRLFEHVREDVRDAVRFALLSGWRLSEVIGLRWADINFPAKSAVTRIKGGATVKRAMTTDMVIILNRQPQVGPFIFTYVCQKSKGRHVDKVGRQQPARRKGDRYPLTKTSLRKPWVQALADAGIENFRFHDLRHTRGTRILRATGNLAVAKEALKHRSIKTTLRYAHAADDDVRQALEASESRTIPEVPNISGKKWRNSAA